MDCVQEEGDFLSDPDAFIASYIDRLDRIADMLEEDLGVTTSFMEIEEGQAEDAEESSDLTPLEALNVATRRKLLVQVEIERVNEEIRAELEYSALVEPVSHPILDFEEDIDAEANVLDELTADLKQQEMTPCLPTVYATNKETNLCIQDAVSNLTVQCAK